MRYTAPKNPEVWNKTLSQTAYTEDKPAEEQFDLEENGERVVLALDTVAKGYGKGLYGDKIIASCDALKQKDGELYFIEFKNQRQSNVDKKDVQAKAFGSLIMVQAALYPEESLASLMQRSNVFVVFQDHRPEEEEDYLNIVKKFGEFAGESGEPIWFGLRQCLERGICKSVHTISISEFNHTYSEKLFATE